VRNNSYPQFIKINYSNTKKGVLLNIDIVLSLGGNMKVYCAWCLRKIGEKAPLEDCSITHSICVECTGTLLIEECKNHIELGDEDGG